MPIAIKVATDPAVSAGPVQIVCVVVFAMRMIAGRMFSLNKSQISGYLNNVF